MEIDVLIEDARWRDMGLEPLAEAAFTCAAQEVGLPGGAWEVAVLACGDARITVLNGDFRGKGAPTNVLSWPSEERGAADDGGTPAPPDPAVPELGDIAIAYDTCLREAEDRGIDAPDHVTHLLVHGFLHLLGYDHTRDGDATLMERLESRILGKMGLPDPYRDDSRGAPASPER